MTTETTDLLAPYEIDQDVVVFDPDRKPTVQHGTVDSWGFNTISGEPVVSVYLEDDGGGGELVDMDPGQVMPTDPSDELIADRFAGVPDDTGLDLADHRNQVTVSDRDYVTDEQVVAFNPDCCFCANYVDQRGQIIDFLLTTEEGSPDIYFESALEPLVIPVNATADHLATKLEYFET